jgi:hypothetical protein
VWRSAFGECSVAFCIRRSVAFCIRRTFSVAFCIRRTLKRELDYQHAKTEQILENMESLAGQLSASTADRYGTYYGYEH